MMPDQTHDPSLRSWVESAHAAGSDFPIQNLPLGAFRAREGGGTPRLGVAIGDRIVDLAHASAEGYLDGLRAELVAACGGTTLNAVIGLGRTTMTALRARVSAMLQEGTPEGRGARGDRALLVAMADVEMSLPCEVGDYSDFYASIDHATNVGSMFRPDNPLLPNYRHVPIGYHGRASSIVVSGTGVKRPRGQVAASPQGPPEFSASRRLDYELEVGAFIGTGNVLGAPIAIDEADAHLAGLVLVNDWSARDLQTWEYQPLGPFLAKNFATTISPWLVTMDALAPFRVEARARGTDEPSPLPYLTSERDRRHGGFAVSLEVWIRTQRMRDANAPAVRLSHTTFDRMYWTLGQMLTHHASNGCNLRPGDLIASGTVSGPEKAQRGCMLELAWRGTEPVELPDGERRTFLEDGDEVIMRGWCEKSGAVRIGFGECRGVVHG